MTPDVDARHRSAQRGAVLVETAIVAAALLTFMLGVVELGIVGFEQLTIDAAGFLNAHQTVIGVKDALGPNDATSQVFPNVKPASYQGATVQVAPVPQVPVDYGYNGTASEQANASTTHVGGASLVQPYILQTSIKQNLFSFFGAHISAYAAATEPEYLESELSYGVSNQNYGGSSTSSLYRSSLFANGELTEPQYFAVWANYQGCNNAPPWNVASPNSCPNSASYIDPLPPYPSSLTAWGPREDSMGVGVYLDTQNWAMGGSGISGPVCASTSCSTTGPFEAAACHQRIYSAIATFVSNNSDLNAIENAYDPMLANAVNHNNVQYFGNPNAFNTTTIGLPAMPNNFAANIHTVYGWDLPSLNNYTGVSEGVNLLNPTAGCT
jgi:hypothetical protein